jgi:hypothetical protein
MNEYEGIAVYAGFSLIVFLVAMIWRLYRDTLMKRFHLLNYYSKDDRKDPHQATLRP